MRFVVPLRRPVWCAAVLLLAAGSTRALRPLAVPLVTCDPYFSIWSCANRLTDAPTQHWTGRPHRLTSLVRVDGRVYRLMGDEPKDVPSLPQTGLRVTPTRSIYWFGGAGVRVTLTFTRPALPDDVALLARPVTYLTWDVASADRRTHSVAVYFDGSAELAVNELSQAVTWREGDAGSVRTMRVGTVDQPVLALRGDRVRIDWGYAYVGAPKDQRPHTAIASPEACRQAFETAGRLPVTGDVSPPRRVDAGAPVLAASYDLGTVGPKPVSRWLILAYDDEHAIRFFARDLRPYWRRHGEDAAWLLQTSAREYSSLLRRCEAFDRELEADLTKAGGPQYAVIGALAYRQCLAGNKIAADGKGQPLLFPKENTSNGCISTVDVIYPMAPMFLLFGPSLSKAMLTPVMEYAQSPRWKFPFAPHDLGTYPQATGQAYGAGETGEEDQMPVEETGNLLILTAALARMEGNSRFADRYWPTLARWAEYLAGKGFDPENQLCTDDFSGHLAHNVNLSAKAIVALGAYGRLCRMHGDAASAKHYDALARTYAARWRQDALDGDHYRLAFDRPGTWSQKYNLVWDRILKLNLFPQSVADTEVAFYKRQQNAYGVPLDNRQTYAKLDWLVWTAALTGRKRDFTTLIAPAYRFLNETEDHVPMADYYWTKDGREAGMYARPVVGGVYIRMLYDRSQWAKWARRDRTRASGWAPLPLPREPSQ